ncbi:transporter substrate-binding domain-containing protein [Leucobacter sp. CSA2]|uniref:Transporter substrate-binding domain-containing protein n=1 Tax=Leucobacter edaphi TaxID=2796472 RepID=A0A934QC60_9MICO|nr:transporter substrate-binding domain-containing protein [Leucobacter edaphi]MBK0421748.1 transporter substrate-binding domain-containing protein [Leucobacter edaphi]
MARFARSTLLLGAIAAVAMGATACSTGGANEAAGNVSNEGGKERTLLVATGASPKPYTFQDEAGNLTGYDIEILKEIDKRLPDVAFEFQVAEFPALFAGLDSGRFDLVANNLSATKERKEKYDFSDPYIEAQFGIILPKNSSVKDVKTLDDLAGKKTYGEPGLNFTRVLEEYNAQHPDKKIEIEYTEADLQTQYKNLATGGIDFLFNERVVYNGYGGQKGLNLDFKPLDGGYLTKTFGTNLYSAYAFSKQKPDVEKNVQEINGALAELKKDGTLKKLSERFFDGVDVTPKTAG